MKTAEIMTLPVPAITDDNCHLYIWSTNNYLPDALKVMEAWGFRYVTMITWVKDRIGLGQYFRGITEHCLFGVKGNIPYKRIDGKRQQGKTVIVAPKQEHSRKPSELYDMIRRVSYGPMIELFARESVSGFDSWGNEI